MFVKPAPGLLVRDPVTSLPLPEEGANVPESSYWLRRVRAGDVEVLVPTVILPERQSGSENP